MKYLIASDIHGSYKYGQIVIDMFNSHNCDRLILLGDILYHGPRNDLPEGHNPKELVKLLNQYADKIICVQGNCDCDVDQMVLNFPIMAPYFFMEVNNRLVCFTHGHVYNSTNLPTKDIILVHGHTHVQVCKQYEDHIYLNPGSIALPKQDSYHGFMILENGVFRWYDSEDNERNSFVVR